VEDDLAHRRARAGRQAGGQLGATSSRLRVEDGEQELLEVAAAHRVDGLLGGQDLVLLLARVEILARGHLDRPADAGQAGALGVAGLQHPELAFLHGELDVLRVLVAALQLVHDRAQLLVAAFQDGSFSLAISSRSLGVRMPATTSSPWASIRYSPMGLSSPVAPSRVKATPVPEVLPMLPYTMEQMLTAVPSRPETLLMVRYFSARSEFQEPNTALMESSSCFSGSCGKGLPTFSK
jgi:hypothetical protein